jgi:hypothetical protein
VPFFDDSDDHVPTCTYTSSMRPLDPVQSCARDGSSSSLGILSVSFSGCGAFYPYMYGIACFLQDTYDLRLVHFLGTSGGCLPALTLATGLDVRESFWDKWNNRVIEASSKMALKGYFSFINICEQMAQEYFPENIHERANGRLHLSTSRVSLRPRDGWSLWNTAKAMLGGIRLLQNQRTSEWKSKDDIIHNVAASCAIPLLCDVTKGVAKSWRGEWHLDGGLTDNQPMLDADTIALQPFMFYQASMLTKMSFIYIRLSPEWHASLFEQGYQHSKENAEKIFGKLPKRTGAPETRPVVPLDMKARMKSQGASAQVAPADAACDSV